MRFAAGLRLLAVLALAACTPDFTQSPTAERAVTIDHPASPAQLEPNFLITDDGAKLPLRVWLPADQPIRAIIVALHGFNDYSHAFEMPAEIWRRHGIATYAYDQRGFGANPDAGRWAGSRTLVQDLAAAVRAAKSRHPGVPVYALGESMGGAVVLDAIGGHTGAERPAVNGVILSAPAVWARETMPIYQRIALWAAIRVIPGMTFTGSGFGILASDNLPMLRQLGRDPLFIKATRVDAIYGLVDLMDEALAAGSGDTLTTLLLYGQHDQLIPVLAMRQLIDSLPKLASGEQRVAYYREGWHMLLRDLEQPKVAEDVAAWIFDHKAALPSGADRDGIAFREGTTLESPAPAAPERLKALTEPPAAIEH